MLTSTDQNPPYFLPTQGSFSNFCDLVSAKGTITLTFLQTWMVIVIDSSYHLPCQSSFEKCLKPVPLSSFPSRLTGSHLRYCSSLWGPNILISLNNPLKSKHWVYKQFQFFYLKKYIWLTIMSSIKYINYSASVSRPLVIWYYLLGRH